MTSKSTKGTPPREAGVAKKAPVAKKAGVAKKASVAKSEGRPETSERRPALDTRGAAFARDLLGALGVAGNAVFSPASVRTALGMALLGARGRTADDLAAGLRLEVPVSAAATGGGDPDVARADFHAAEAARLARWSDPSRPFSLVSASAVFVAETLRRAPGAEASLREGYLAPMRALDFERDPAGASAAINGWVREATRGLVPEIAAPGVLGEATRLVIANALYFKGEWRTRFLREATHDAPFELASGERAMVSSMQQTAQHRAWVGPEAEVLEMAYQGDDLAMTFLLPPRGVTLSDFEPRVQAEALSGWLARLEEQRVRVTVPRFTLDAGAISLRAPLESMGIRAPFDAAVADFGGLFEDPLVLDDVLHRARIDVNEQGTEAAAATLVLGRQSGGWGPHSVFTIDRPFLFLLRDLRDGSLLFLGRVTDPR